MVDTVGDTCEYLVEIELGKVRVVELFPRTRCRDPRPCAPAERVRRDRRFLAVVLAPIQEHLATTGRLRHHARGEIGVLALNVAGQLFDDRRDFVARLFTWEVGVEVNALAAACYGERIKPHVAENAARDARYLGALRQFYALTRVEVEDEPVRAARNPGWREAPLRHVEFHRGDLSEPHQGGDVFDEWILFRSVCVLDRLTGDPRRSTGFELFRKKRVGGVRCCADTIDPPLAGDRAAVQMGEEQRSDCRVVGNDFTLCGAGFGVDDFVEVGDAQTTLPDLHNLPLSDHMASVVKGLVCHLYRVFTVPMRTIWKGALTFGLVNVPVKVYSATEDHDVPLHQVHEKDGGRIRYQRTCEVCGEIVAYADIDRAYVDDGQTVVLTKDDLAALPSEKSREIDVVEFVPSDQVDLLTLDKPYYLEPDSKSPKSYVLLRKTLEATDRTAIVRFTLRQKTRLAALRVRDKVLVLQTLLWADEVREAAFPALDEDVRISKKELELSASLVESYSADFEPESFVDEYQKELRTLIDAKIDAGDTFDVAETFGETEKAAEGGEVIDLMEALRASVARSKEERAKNAG